MRRTYIICRDSGIQYVCTTGLIGVAIESRSGEGQWQHTMCPCVDVTGFIRGDIPRQEEGFLRVTGR